MEVLIEHNKIDVEFLQPEIKVDTKINNVNVDFINNSIDIDFKQQEIKLKINEQIN